jgi:hypothetical protein
MHAAFSRYIRPGSRIIDSDNGNTLAALTPEGALVLIVRNSGSSDVKYEFDLGEFVKIGTSAKVVRFELPGSLTKQSDIVVSGKALSMTAKSNTITTMVIEGAEGGACKPDSIIPYSKINNNEGWSTATEISLSKGDSLSIGPHPWEGGRWVWSGPNNFTSTNREIHIGKMDGTMSGYYKAVHTNASGCEGSVTFKVIVDDPDHPFVEPDTTKQDSTDEDSTTAIGQRGIVGMLQPLNAGESIQVFDMQGRFLGHSLKQAPGTYLVRQGKNLRQVRIK